MRSVLPLGLLLAGCGATWEPVDGKLGVDCPTDALRSWYTDADGDGFGDPRAYKGRACLGAADQVSNSLDCDDTDPDVNPDAQEVCNGIDDDCVGESPDDDAVDARTWYPDVDGDGFGDGTLGTTACTAPWPNALEDGRDCDDGDANIHPAATETCDGVDEDCDGEIDEGTGAGDTWYRDEDGDGYGVTGQSVLACAQPEGYAAESGDCLDTDSGGYAGAEVHPGSTRVEVPFDGVDSDCDGVDACTDLDCNGLPDIVIPNYERSNGTNYAVPSIIHLDAGAGGTVSVSFTAVRAMIAADLDEDGYLDLVAATERSTDTNFETTSAIRWGGAPDDAGRFDDSTLLPTSGARDVEVADLDDDGHLDLVFANSRTNAGSGDVDSVVYWGDGNDFDSARATPLQTRGAVDVLATDVDGDGRLDLVFCNRTAGEVTGSEADWTTTSTIYWNTGSTPVYRELQVTELTTTGCSGVHADDINGDGILDLFFSAVHDGQGRAAPARAYISLPDDPRHTASISVEIDVDWTRRLRTGDFDQDGDPDVLAFTDQDLDSGGWGQSGRALYGTGGATPTWPSGTSRALDGDGAAWGVVVDLDGNGTDDVVLPGYQDDGGDTAPGSAVWFGRSGGLTTASRLLLDTPNARFVTVADVDEDGLLDLLFLGSTGAADPAVAALYLAEETPSATGGYPATPLSLDGAQVTRAPALVVGAAEVVR